MIHAYDHVYLTKAQSTLAWMLDFAVYELKYDIAVFIDLFIVSGIASRFENGDFTVIAGKSGIELAYEVLEHAIGSVERISPRHTVGRSEEYWTGWALAYYQWVTSLSFTEIIRYIPIKDIQMLYSPYHEMDIRQFVDTMNRKYKSAKQETNLKLLRRRLGLSQSELAELSNVPVRTIQQYEQRQKNINKAQGEYLIRFSHILCCNIEDLFERIGS